MSRTMGGIVIDAKKGKDVGGFAAGQPGEPPRGRSRLTGGPANVPGPARERVDELLTDELVDELLAGARTLGEINGPDGLLKQLTRRFVERAMETELTDYLGYEPHLEPPGRVGNTRNGSTRRR